MKIAYLQKISLQDFPDKISCIVFCSGCNFRCGYCHNPELALDKLDAWISEKEFFEFLDSRKGKLEGVVITGGEPLINSDIIEFCEKIKEKGFEVMLDTNGSRVETIKKLLKRKVVDYVALDIKNSKDKYEQTINTKINLNEFEETIKLIINSGIDYEFRITVVKGLHNFEEFEKIKKWLSGLAEKNNKKLKKLVIQNFVNSGKVLDENFKNRKGFSYKELEDIKEVFKNLFEKVLIRN